MSSPGDNSSILSGTQMSSPRPIRHNSEHSHSPARRQGSVNNEDVDILPPRLSPTLIRSYNPNDADHLERQRTMDADMAMHLSRARSNTIVASPVLSPVLQSRRSTDDQAFPALSLQEQRDLDVAKIGGRGNGDLETSPGFHPGPVPDAHLNHLSVGQDPALLVSLDVVEPDDSAMGGLPMYQASEDRPHYDFSTMENFAKEEKTRLGIHSPTSPTGGFDFRNLGKPSTSVQTHLDENAHPSGSNAPPSIRIRRATSHTTSDIAISKPPTSKTANIRTRVPSRHL